jgi:hypothetical protein
MFFTKFGAIIAGLTVVCSLFQIVVGFAVAIFGSPEMAAGILGGRTTGRAINQGMLWLVVGLALGMLAEISRSVAASSEGNEGE